MSSPTHTPPIPARHVSLPKPPSPVGWVPELGIGNTKRQGQPPCGEIFDGRLRREWGGRWRRDSSEPGRQQGGGEIVGLLISNIGIVGVVGYPIAGLQDGRGSKYCLRSAEALVVLV